MSVLVFSEDRELSFQLLARASEITSQTGSNTFALASDSPEDYINQGADRVVLVNFDENSLESCRVALLKTIDEIKAEIILIGATKLGKEVAPRISAALGVGCMTECFKVDFLDGETTAERLTYGGSTIATETSSSIPTIITVPSRSFDKLEPKNRVGEITEIKITAPESRIKVIERRVKPKGDQDLENADIIISAGRGFKKKEDLKMLEELAEALGGAAVGCTRPISADLGWMKDWVGISGKKVKPSLYITCGISGQIQHVAGIRDSKVIISINNDENAGIHGVSDYSIIGDIYEVIPALINAMKEKA